MSNCPRCEVCDCNRTLGYGWLGADPAGRAASEGKVEGVALDIPGTRTRFEEFSLLARVARSVPAGYACDAATGYVRNWHIAPYVLANLGWQVHASDLDPRTLGMPEHPQVERVIANMTSLPLADSVADLVCCISVLEHVGVDVQRAFAAEAARIAKPGALLVITADAIPPGILASLFNDRFDIGFPRNDPEHKLSPEVSYVIGRRR